MKNSVTLDGKIRQFDGVWSAEISLITESGHVVTNTTGFVYKTAKDAKAALAANFEFVKSDFKNHGVKVAISGGVIQ
jgi:hypothetical protein